MEKAHSCDGSNLSFQSYRCSEEIRNSKNSAELIYIFILKTCANNYIHAKTMRHNYLMDGPSDAYKIIWHLLK